MDEMAKLNPGTMETLKDFSLRPGMSMDEIRAALHENMNHGQSSPDGMVDCIDSGKHLKIGNVMYTPGELKKLLDAQALPARMEAPGALRPLNVIEASITLHKEQATRGFLGIGRDLIDAKAQIGQHGQWMPWLERMGFNQSMANKYMQVARAVSEGSALEGLSFTQIAALLALPAGEREAFAIENGVADKSGAEIKKLIAERDQLKKERDEARENWNTYQGSAIHWKQEADFRAQRIEELQNAEPRTVKVVETPDDYQQLKMAAAHHQAEMEEAAQAAEEAEQRAAAAEAELARIRMQGGGKAPDKMEKVAGLANDFLIAAQLLPYDREIMGSAQGRRQCELVVKQIRAWVLDMQQALEFGALDAEGAVV